jgi:hypothetical protein
VPSYRQALVLELSRSDSLYPDAMAFTTGAVRALTEWADGPVVDLTAERVWSAPSGAGSWWASASIQPAGECARGLGTGRTVGDAAHARAREVRAPDFAALDVPDEGVRAVGSCSLISLPSGAHTRVAGAGNAFDPGFGQPMVAFVEAPPTPRWSTTSEGHPASSWTPTSTPARRWRASTSCCGR